MSNNRKVTERDFRQPEFLDADPEDFEFRSDGKIVRKDRWEAGIRNIASILGLNSRSFEIDDVVEAVRALQEAADKDVEDPDPIV